MKFQLFKRLVSEDFSSDQQSLIGKIATIYNPMIDQLNTGFHNKLDFSNLNQQVQNFTLMVDITGKPTNAIQLISALSTPCQGITCINAVNQTDTIPLTGAPFIVFTRSGNTVTIVQVLGLVADKKYNITAILIG